jgi:ferric-dicitrate binding protein FerR (iron transport regulator)
MSKNVIIIEKFINSELDISELETFYKKIEKDKEFRELYFQLNSLNSLYNRHKRTKQYESEKEWKLLKSKIATNRISINYVQVVASILITLLLSYSYSNFINKNSNTDLISHKIYTPVGQQTEIVLSDGSKISLNSCSEIEIDKNFGLSNRSIKLSGEAYFEIKKSTQHKFTVNTTGQKIKVLGTKFNVKAYPKDQKIETTLLEGKINLKIKDQDIYMQASDQLIYNIKHNKITKSKVVAKEFIEWEKGRVKLKNANIFELVKTLERWYPYKFIFDSKKFKMIKFSGAIKKDKTIEHLLSLLEEIYPLKYKIKENKIYLNIKTQKQ